MTNLLSQTSSVHQLLLLTIEAVKHVKDDNLKSRMIEALDVYKGAISPSTIYLSEIWDLARLNNVQLTEHEAINILTNAALDIDLNYASRSIEYYFDEFVCRAI